MKPNPGEWKLTAVAAGTLAISVAVPLGNLPEVILCPFRQVTGLPCPGCGLTRGFVCIGHGQIGQAIEFNPFALPLFALTAFQVIGFLIELGTGWNPARLVRQSRFFMPGLVSMATMMFAFNIFRIVRM